MRWRSSSAAFSFALAACATGAPPLPDATDTPASSATAMPATCGALLQEWDETGRVRDAMEGKIAQNRNTNQTLTYFGGLFPPLLLGTEGNAAEKQRLLDIQARRDELIRAGRQLGCPALR